MSRAFGGPGKYIQKDGAINELPHYVAMLGERAVVVADPAVYQVLNSLFGNDDQFLIIQFTGEATRREIARIVDQIKMHSATVVVAAGGGKAIDTGKIAAIETNSRILVVPTIASTDAPCSAVAVTYTEEGIYEDSLRLPRNPDIVLADSRIIVAAPVRFLVAGIGDAFSTFYEARSNLESRTPNYVAGGFPPTEVGIAIARRCHDLLEREAVKAVYAARAGLLTGSVEQIIEVNILLSGLGFENMGCSAAHGIHDGLTVLKATHKFLHGEKVAFGTLCLLMLENREEHEIRSAVKFCHKLGLPVQLSDLNLENAGAEDIERVAEASLVAGHCTYATPVTLTVPKVRDAILATDAFAKEVLG